MPTADAALTLPRRVRHVQLVHGQVLLLGMVGGWGCRVAGLVGVVRGGATAAAGAGLLGRRLLRVCKRLERGGARVRAHAGRPR